MPKPISCGLMAFSKTEGELKILLAHPGGPFFKNKDIGHWSIPKGLPEKEDDDKLETAKREFEEETGIKPTGDFYPLGSIEQKNKIVYAWGFSLQLKNPIEINCNTFKLEWPPKSGKYVDTPEIDKAEFFSIDEAKEKIRSTQIPLIERLVEFLDQNDNK